VRIEIVGRNVEVTEEIREHVRRRFNRVAKQVSEQARLEVVLREEANPAIPDGQVAEARLFVKGKTLYAEESASQMLTAIKALSQDIKRQVKRHRELRRSRATARRTIARMRGRQA
jgi:putative sigma-54 modulation protein